MTRNLPTGFEDWPEEAKTEYLKEARNRYELMELIVSEIDAEIEIQQSGRYIALETLAEVYHALED